MLLYIFKHNRILFRKEDFKDHYEEQKVDSAEGGNSQRPPEPKQEVTENNLEEVKLGYSEDSKGKPSFLL